MRARDSEEMRQKSSPRLYFFLFNIECLPTFSAALVPEVFFTFIFPKGFFFFFYIYLSLLKKRITNHEQNSCEVNHNVTNFDLKQKRILRIGQKDKIVLEIGVDLGQKCHQNGQKFHSNLR